MAYGPSPLLERSRGLQQSFKPQLAPYQPPPPVEAAAAMPQAEAAFEGDGDALVDYEGHKIAAGNRAIFDDVRKRFGLKFTSGHRDEAANKAAGGVAKSWHLKGYAGDFVGTAKQMNDALAYARSRPGLLEALVHNAGSGQHLHVAFKPQTMPRRPSAPQAPTNMPMPKGGVTVGKVSGLTPAEAWIIQRESGGRPDAFNKTVVYDRGKRLGNAWGIGQIVDDRPISQRPQTVQEQLQVFRDYVKRRYGTAENAQAFWQKNHWY